jgi:hypothetical protein
MPHLAAMLAFGLIATSQYLLRSGTRTACPHRLRILSPHRVHVRVGARESVQQPQRTTRHANCCGRAQGEPDVQDLNERCSRFRSWLAWPGV